MLRLLLLVLLLAPALAADLIFRTLDDDMAAQLQRAATFYASFDESVRGDFGGGGLEPGTRYNHETEKGQFVFEKGIDGKVFRIARDKGVAGGALEPTDVLPKNGRIFFPVKGNLAFKKGGWGGAVSVWCKTDPNALLKTKFCDPVQITEKGANDGGLWFDFNDAMPRDLRHGVFPAVPKGEKGAKEDDPDAPLVRVPKVDWKADAWHHVVLSWKNFDTGKADAVSSLYIDGKRIGQVKDRAIAMDWDVEKAGVYVAINYLGLLDELALFDRALTEAEVGLLHRRPGLLSPLKKELPRGDPMPFPFKPGEGAVFLREYTDHAGLPLAFTNRVGMTFRLIPPGTFVMGSPKDEPGHGTGGFDETAHAVTIPRPFYLATTETTVGQFRRFVEATRYVTDGEKNGGGHAHDAKAEWKHRPGVSWRKPGYAGPFELTDNHPVVQVSHADGTAFCRWLAEQPRADGEPRGTYGLPREAQWEWACRAGSEHRFWWGPDEDATGKVANVGDRALKRTHPDWPRTVMAMDDGHAFAAPVASYQANAFGLHDMLGNVWEFCSTRYGPYPKGPTVDDGEGDPTRGFAVRGGGWSNVVADARCATRNADPPHFCHSNLGFRVALQLPR